MRRSSSKPLFRTLTWISIVLFSSFLSFYVGVWTGIQVASSSGDGGRLSHSPTHYGQLTSTIPKDVSQRPDGGSSSLFSKSISHFAQGLARVSKDDLMQTFDFGVPPNPNTQGMDALILYNKKEALPNDENVARAVRFYDPTKPLPRLTANEATENCDTMNVVLLNNPGNTRQCFALIGGQYPSYHIQRWMRRRSNDKGALDASQPLTLTSRGYTASGKQEFVPPKEKHVTKHQAKLLTYLTEGEGIKSTLRKILEKISKQNTVVVITCNHGQSELLMNFACSARARGFDLHNVLIFPTDSETKELSEGMGLTTFYDEKLMASIPKKEASAYGDSVFTSVMFAKVLCVQLVNELGYDVLFQDADVVWYKNPLDYFHDKSLTPFDIYFQDDGSRAERYAPYSANSGFYFVRSNAKTRHFFRHFLYSSDLIDAWSSHQQVMIALLAEHSSLMGLKVKVFPKEMEEFPGGVQFHRWKEAMKKIFRGDSKAYIFHMSWTQNKDDKVEFYQQMGEWYLNNECIGKGGSDVLGGSPPDNAALVEPCCSADPLITCHYKDKPSKIKCPDSPFITEVSGKSFFKAFTKEGVSFW